MVGSISFRFAFSSLTGEGLSSNLFVDAALISSVADCISSSLKVPKDALGAVGSRSVYSILLC